MADLYAGMFFALGFLTAGLIALMLAPAIWRRAVRLTRRRIEAATPLTLTEIRADKDQLRADFALTTRRLEMSVMELKTKAAEQLVEIERKRELVRQLTAERDDKAARVADMELRERKLRADLRDREHELGRSVANMHEAERLIDARARDLAEIEARLGEVRSFVDGQKVELVSRSTRIDTLEATLATLRAERATESARLRALEADLRTREAQLASERERSAERDERIGRMIAELDERDAAVEHLSRHVARLQDELRRTEAVATRLDAAVGEQARRRVAAEIEATDLRVRAALGEDAPAALIQSEVARERRVAEMDSLRAGLVRENDALRRSVGETWEGDRRDNAAVRERLNDVAAELSRVTAAIDGDAAASARVRSDAGLAPARPAGDADKMPRQDAAE